SGAGALDGEKALLLADAAMTGAGRAVFLARAALGARAVADIAGFVDGNFDYAFLALEGVFQRDFLRVLQVLAAALRPAAAPAAHVTEHILEDVGKGAAEAGEVGRIKTAGPTATHTSHPAHG